MSILWPHPDLQNQKLRGWGPAIHGSTSPTGGTDSRISLRATALGEAISWYVCMCVYVDAETLQPQNKHQKLSRREKQNQNTLPAL